MEAKLEVKETLDILEAVGGLVDVSGKVFADGKVALDDLVHLKSLADQLPLVVEAARGAGEVPKELKDIDAAEVQQLLAAVMGLALKVKGAFPKKA